MHNKIMMDKHRARTSTRRSQALPPPEYPDQNILRAADKLKVEQEKKEAEDSKQSTDEEKNEDDKEPEKKSGFWWPFTRKK